MTIVLLLIAVVLGLGGFTMLSDSTFFGILLIVVAFLLLVGSLRRKRKPDARRSVSVRRTPPATQRAKRRSKRRLRAVGNVEPICPHCDQRLEKKPGRKKKCPHCGDFIFVRTRPSDEQRVLVTEAEVEEIEEQWSIVNGTHDEYLAQKSRFARERVKLAQRFGREPTENDVRWSLLNQELIQHAKQENWGLFRNAKFEMAEILGQSLF